MSPRYWGGMTTGPGRRAAPAQPFACPTCQTLHAYFRSAIVKPAAALLAAAVLLSLAACSTGHADVNKAESSSSATADSGKSSTAEKAAGIPDAPTGNDRDAYLDAIAAVDPQIIVDEQKAIDAGRNQCASLAGDGFANVDWLAAQRFGNDARPLTDAQGKQLNAALRGTLCPE